MGAHSEYLSYSVTISVTARIRTLLSGLQEPNDVQPQTGPSQAGLQDGVPGVLHGGSPHTSCHYVCRYATIYFVTVDC